MSSLSIRCILFDLDGTLLDTAPDLIGALNLLLKEHNLPLLSLASARSLAGLGSKAMIKHAFLMDEENPSFNTLREKFITLYEDCIAETTCFFPHVENVLQTLDERAIPWGIVTNKLTRHTMTLLKKLRIEKRPACIVCGDSLTTYKPDPAPILHACQLLNQDPKHCLYVGDAATDVYAGKAAGTAALVALYGYIHADENPYIWGADGCIQSLDEIMDWIAKYP